MRTPAFSLTAALLLGATLTGSVRAGTPASAPLPANLGLGLRDLARDYRTASAATPAPVRVLSPRSRLAPASPAATAAAATAAVNARMQTAMTRYTHLQADASGRILVDIYGDGTVSPALLRKQFAAMGLAVSGEIDWYRHGLYSAWVPPSQIENLARLAGVHTARLSPRPQYRVGQTTSQGAAVLHADTVNASGYDGSGIKVGVLSDSFNDTAPQDPAGVPDDAALDQVMNDLPTAGVSVLLDDPIVATATDEGRAMCQIVHDLAPGASIAFATAEGGESTFAADILGLGTPVGSLSTGTPAYPGMGCNVICDDVSYLAEPMYSDGVIAQAIDTVATQYGVSYFSSAGNDGNSGYQATFTYTDPTTVINATTKKVTTPDSPAPGLDFSYTTDSSGNTTGVDPTLYAGGLHSFGNDASGKPIVAQKVTVGSLATSLVFQWNDPFDAGAVTTDYNILVFDATGAYQSGMSGTAANISSGSLDLNGTDEPIEMPATALAASTSYYIVLSRATPTGSTASPATRFRYAAESDGGGFSGDFIGLDSIETYGHNCAANCSGVAAYVYDAIPNVTNAANHVATPLVEPYSSNGPVEIYFDSAGNRLTTPNRRRQPAFAAVDGVNTSFFPPATTNIIVPGTPFGDLPIPVLPGLPITTGPNPNDYDGDGFPNFFGTSAAAPHAAAVAALVMQASNTNGFGPLTPSYIRTLLQSTTQGQADTAPGYCVASGTAGGYKVSLSGMGDVSTDPNTFRVTLLGAAGYQLASLAIDLSPSGLVFDEDATTGYPFTQGNTGTTDANGATLQTATQPILSTDRTMATLLFSGFNPGAAVTFGVDRDVAGINAYGNGVDQLQGSTFTATLTGGGAPITVKGTFTNLYSRVYNFKAGYGLIDAQAAINRLLAQ